MDVLRSLRARRPRPLAVPGPDAAGPALTWIGDERTGAAALVLSYRTEAQLVPAYVCSVERWLATAAR